MRARQRAIWPSWASERLLGMRDLCTYGQVWFVDSASGADAAGARGLNPEYPLATLGQAVANAGSTDIIVLAPTHDETLTAKVNFTSMLTIVGAGRSGGKPMASLTNNVAGDNALTFGWPCEWRNVRFKESGALSTTYRMAGYTAMKLRGCLFEVGDNDPTSGTSSAIVTGASGDHMVFEDCVFKSVATDPTVPPVAPVYISAGADDVTLRRCTFDAGLSGFDDGWGLNTGVVDGLVLEDLALLGADVQIFTGSTFRYNCVVQKYGACVVS